MKYPLDIAKQHLDAWLKAELALTTGQAYTIQGRSITRVSPKEIRENIKIWQNRVDAAERAITGKRPPSRQRQIVLRG